MSTTLPPAPPGTFRLFRLLALYPTPKIRLQTFPYPHSDSSHDFEGSLSAYACPTYDAISYAWNPHPEGDVNGFSTAAPILAVNQPVDVVVGDHNHSDNITIYVTSHLLYGTDPPDGDAMLSQCLIANAYDDQTVDSEQLADDYLSFARWLENHTWGDTSSGSTDSSTKPAALRFANRFQRMAKKRAFFTTKSGRAGLCSSRTLKGDVVGVFMNFRLPYLLHRVDGDNFEMVGEAYVDGMMHGEAFDDHIVKGQPREVIIC